MVLYVVAVLCLGTGGEALHVHCGVLFQEPPKFDLTRYHPVRPVDILHNLVSFCLGLAFAHYANVDCLLFPRGLAVLFEDIYPRPDEPNAVIVLLERIPPCRRVAGPGKRITDFAR